MVKVKLEACKYAEKSSNEKLRNIAISVFVLL